MKKRGFNRGKTHRLRDFELSTTYSQTSTTYYVELWEQPFYRWVVAQVYHWYDMRIFKVPGFKRLEKWLAKRHDHELYIPLSCQQDIRCYHLSRQKRTVLAIVEIDKPTFDKLSNTKCGVYE